MYLWIMARAATTSDAFNAVAEPRRREILSLLILQERPIDLLVVRRDGRRMLYRTNAEAIRPLHEWASTFERYWRHQLSRIKERAELKIKSTNEAGSDSGKDKEKT